MLTIQLSTSDYGKAFLARAWKERKTLTDPERRGFAQFFYLTVLGHLEFALSQHIQQRLFFLRGQIASTEFPPHEHTHNGVAEIHDSTPLQDSLLSVLNHGAGDAEKAALGKLVEIHNRVFSKSITQRIGPALNDDLNALVALRNIFAHGRWLSVTVVGSFPGQGTLDGNELKKPALQLRAAGILTDLSFDTMTSGDLTTKFYSDDALLYFYGKAMLIEKVLFETMDFGPETYQLQSLSPLPVLE